ncbi:TPA: hypothetical protein N2P55_003598 [Escherichia coli]|nr:hypothetical protein [Escherichia coli]HCL6287059.1 hypothetical protein [Escherichia coli]
MKTVIKIFYTVLALIWMPSIVAIVGNIIGMLQRGLAEIPYVILLISLSALSINLTCYLLCKYKNEDISELKYSFRLFFASLILIPFSWGVSKAMSDPVAEQSQPITNEGLNTFQISIGQMAKSLLIAAPVLTSVVAIFIAIYCMFELLKSKKKA